MQRPRADAVLSTGSTLPGRNTRRQPRPTGVCSGRASDHPLLPFTRPEVGWPEVRPPPSRCARHLPQHSLRSRGEEHQWHPNTRRQPQPTGVCSGRRRSPPTPIHQTGSRLARSTAPSVSLRSPPPPTLAALARGGTPMAPQHAAAAPADRRLFRSTSITPYSHSPDRKSAGQKHSSIPGEGPEVAGDEYVNST